MSSPTPQILARWLVLVKWLLLFPHYLVLAVLYMAFFVVLIVAWFAILFTAKFPRGLLTFRSACCAGATG